MLSIITVINNREVYHQYLKPSLEKQTGVDFEVVEIDNSGNRFDSLYEAYRSAEERIRGDRVLFVHPDVVFLNPSDLADYLERADRSREADPDCVLWGVAGAKQGEQKEIVTKILQGPEKQKRDAGFDGRGVENVQTVDACCFLMSRETYRQYGFCEEIKGFHLLAEELCLRIAARNQKVCVLPVTLWHLSPGASLDYRYYLAVLKVFRLHPEIDWLCTTSYYWVRRTETFMRLKYYAARNYVHHKLKA